MPEGPNQPTVLIECDAEAATARAAEMVQSVICEAAAGRGTCCMALAGGTTPHDLYQQLAHTGTDEQVPWSRVQIFFGDERDVPLDHVESNYNMAQRTLLDHVPVPPSQIHPMRGDADDIDAAAAEYEATLRRMVPSEDGNLPRFDLLLLGMGGDGHTASLFPRTPALAETERLVLANPVRVLGRKRITMTFPLINAARNVLMLVTGEDKADAIGSLLSPSPRPVEDLPAAGVKPTDGKWILILDAPAARQWRRSAE